MKLMVFLIGTLLVGSLSLQSQDKTTVSWWNPAHNDFNAIEGQAWPNDDIADYNRLPYRAKGNVANDVWGNSTHAAGLMIRFRSNSPSIKIRYQVQDRKNYGMDHMPATGKSGVDLYAIDSDGGELWCKGLRNFSDTITYSYILLNPNDRYHEFGREYRLYLPLYNHVDWLEIGVSDTTYFEALPVRNELPIIVYGTSIAHGACASRPGMAWTSILSRNLDRPLINLGFSGSWERNNIKDGSEVKTRILNAVRQLRESNSNTPILLTEHAGYTEEYISNIRKSHFSIVNQIQKEAFHQLKDEGVENLFYLTKEEIGLTMDDMVDGTHPTDLGMYHYAKAYEKKLRSILNEPKGNTSTTQPCIQAREPYNYNWEKRHREILTLNEADPPKTVIFANSIVHFWGGQPIAKTAREEATWSDFLTPAGVRNLAYGWDRIENVLWRVYHGELEGYDADRVIVMIGTNNLHLNSNDEILEGMNLIIEAIKIRQPIAKITIVGILPRREYESRIKLLNFQIAELTANHNLQYQDIGTKLLNNESSINESLFSDGLHPNKDGYLLLRDEMVRLCTPNE